MNSTPNYNFNDDIKLCVVDAIDRELRRVEDKADASAAAILDRYTKAEIDCLLRKCGGGSCSGTCDCGPELEKLWQALRARYSNEEIDRLILGYIREHDGYPDAHPAIWEELRNLYRELENWPNKDPLKWKSLELLDGYYGARAEYTIDDKGQVYLRGQVGKNNGALPANETFGKLPEGFRPVIAEHFPASTAVYSNADNLMLPGDGLTILHTGELIKRSSRSANENVGVLLLDGISFFTY